MSIELLIWLCPLLSVGFFSAIEYKKNKPAHYLTPRFQALLILILLTYIANWALSTYLTTPLASMIPYGLISLSNLEIPSILKLALYFLVMDFFHYWLHRLHHMVPFLWRLHRLHHSDKAVDAMTTFLHHPLEVVSSFIILITLYVVFDMPFIAIILYALIQSLHAGFTHFNRLVPEETDRYLRKLIITPNTHKVHHALDFKESNSNFGQVFIVWDVLFNTCQFKPNAALNNLATGIDKKQSPSSAKLMPWLINPLQ